MEDAKPTDASAGSPRCTAQQRERDDASSNSAIGTTDQATAACGLAELAIESVPHGVVIINSRGEVVAFNTAAGRIFGVDPKAMIGGSLEPLFVPGMFVQHQQYIQDHIGGKRDRPLGAPIESEGWHSSGHRVPVEIRISEAALGGERFFLASIQDISSRREDSQRLRALSELAVRAQRIETLGTLSAGIAHDFANTLGAIIGYASTLLGELPRRERHYSDAAKILALAHRARRLTETLLAFSGSAETISETVALNRVVRDVMSIFRGSIPPSILVKLHLAADTFVEGDAAQLEQCVTNLCLNARDAMPDGGELVVETRRLDLRNDEAEAEKLRPGCYCVLEVRDNGIGMDEATLAQLGRPFFSTKPRGVGHGLGLNVVQTIVQAHGGTIRFGSELGKGSQVRLLLPASKHTPAHVPSRRSPRTAARSAGETILVVDDNRYVREMTQRLLEYLGYRVIPARTGQEALRLYSDQQTRIGLVLLDLQLTDMDGAEALQLLKQLNPGVRVLVCSGLPRGDLPERMARQGASGFVSKPYGTDEIAEAIRKALATH